MRSTFEGNALKTLCKNPRLEHGANTILLLRDLIHDVNAFINGQNCCNTAFLAEIIETLHAQNRKSLFIHNLSYSAAHQKSAFPASSHTTGNCANSLLHNHCGCLE